MEIFKWLYRLESNDKGVLEHINSGLEAIATRNTESFIFETAFEKK